MQRRGFLSLIGLGGAIASAPVAAATIAIAKSKVRDEVSAVIPNKGEPPKQPYFTFDCQFNNIRYGSENSYANTVIGIDPKYSKDTNLLQFKIDDVTMSSTKFVELENGSYVMMFEKEKV